MLAAIPATPLTPYPTPLASYPDVRHPHACRSTVSSQAPFTWHPRGEPSLVGSTAWMIPLLLRPEVQKKPQISDRLVGVVFLVWRSNAFSPACAIVPLEQAVQQGLCNSAMLSPACSRYFRPLHCTYTCNTLALHLYCPFNVRALPIQCPFNPPPLPEIASVPTTPAGPSPGSRRRTSR